MVRLGTHSVSWLLYRVISKLMVQCANEACQREIDQYWTFCPYCGQDTRPEDSSRIPPPRHNHRFVTGGDFCVDCGGKYNDQYYDVPEFARKIGWPTFGVGAGTLVAAGLIWTIHAFHGPGFELITPWYDAGKIYVGQSGNNFKATNGPVIIEWMLAIGTILAIAGFATAKTKRPQFFHGDYIK